MSPDSRAIPSWSDRAYRRLLSLYPREFRARFEPEMLELFRARRAAAGRRGIVGRLRFAATTGADVWRSAWQAHRAAGHLPALLPLQISDGVKGDVRTALRRLRRSPALTATIIGLLALAIGSATVVFSVVNTVLLKPLPFAAPDRIVSVWEARGDSTHNNVSGHEYPEWARRAQTFDAMAAMIYNDGLHLSGAGEPKSVLGVRVSASFFQVMGVTPALGRAFTAEDDVEGHGQVVILSDRLWRDRFGANRNALGREIRLNDRAFSVVGVMPPEFAFPPAAGRVTPDVWTPIAEPIERYRGRHYLSVVGRLKPGVTIAQAQAEMSAIAASMAEALPEFNTGHGVNIVSLHGDLVRNTRSSLLLLFGSVGCLLLIGCSNVAGLLLARGLARRREVGLELALGATRLRVARQLFVESLVMSLSGGALGLSLAYWLIRLVPALVPPDTLTAATIAIDPTVLLFVLAVSVFTGLLFGVAPAIQLRRVGIADTLRRGGRSLLGGEHPRVRRALVSAQVALAVLLVLGAGLMMRGLLALHQVDPGFQTDRTAIVNLALRGPRYAGAIAQREFFQTAEAKLAAIPGVTSVAATNNVPLSGGNSGIMIDVEGRPAPPPGEEASAQYRIVSPGFFTALGIPLMAGREFSSADARLAVPLIRWYPQQPLPPLFDRPQATPVAVINESMAKKYWPNERALDRRFRALMSPWITIAGVVPDTHTVSLRGDTGPEFYLTDLQEPQGDMSVLIRTATPSTDLTSEIRGAVKDLDPGLPITSMMTMDDVLGGSFSQARFTSTLLGAFAVMALILMTAGVYGLISFTTAQRLPEMGVRLALGAPRAEVHRLILRDALAMTGVGLVAGLVTAAGAGRFIADQLNGVTPTDLLTYGAVTAVVIVVVTIACWLPARRASRVDPLVVLRQE